MRLTGLAPVSILLAGLFCAWSASTGLAWPDPGDPCLLEELGEPTALSIGPAGKIAVYYRSAGRLLVIDEEDGRVDPVTGLSEDELREATGLGWLGDRFYVAVLRPSRIAWFDSSGDFVEVSRIQVPNEWANLRVSGPHKLGSESTALSVTTFRAGAVSSGFLRTYPIVSYDIHARAPHADTVALLDAMARTVFVRVGGEDKYRSPPIPTGDLYAVSKRGDGVVLVTGLSDPREEPRMVRIDLSGDTLFSRRLDFEPVPVPESERDAVRRSLRTWVSESATSGAEVERAVRSLPPVPQWHRAVSQALVTSDGHIWIRSPEGEGNDVEWRIFSEHGMEMGRLSLPSYIRVLDSARNSTWFWNPPEECLQSAQTWG